jgi:hypothetical protein
MLSTPGALFARSPGDYATPLTTRRAYKTPYNPSYFPSTEEKKRRNTESTSTGKILYNLLSSFPLKKKKQKKQNSLAAA